MWESNVKNTLEETRGINSLALEPKKKNDLNAYLAGSKPHLREFWGKRQRISHQVSE